MVWEEQLRNYLLRDEDVRSRVRDQVFQGAERSLSATAGTSDAMESAAPCIGSVGFQGPTLMAECPALMAQLLRCPGVTLDKCHEVLQAAAKDILESESSPPPPGFPVPKLRYLLAYCTRN